MYLELLGKPFYKRNINVYSIPNKETVVAGISDEDVQDIFLIRNQLEGLAARKAAESITDSELKQLKEILELTQFYGSKKDIERIGELDHQFHDLIYKATKSKIFKQVLSDFHTYVQKTRCASLQKPGRIEGLIREHTNIYQALADKDGKTAEIMMNKHIDEVSRNMHLNDEK